MLNLQREHKAKQKCPYFLFQNCERIYHTETFVSCYYSLSG